MLKVYAHNERMKLAEGYGSHMEKRYEVLEKYSYCDIEGKLIASWHMVFHSTDLKKCKEYFEKYKNEKRKNYKIPDLIF